MVIMHDIGPQIEISADGLLVLHDKSHQIMSKTRRHLRTHHHLDHAYFWPLWS